MTRFIAEIGSNHNRALERTLALLDAAAATGAQAAKLQVFRLEDLFAPEVLASHEELRARRAWELPLELLDPISGRCRELGLELGATPFGLWAIEALLPYVDFFKVASYELLWLDLIAALAATGKPLVMSTGMANMDEVDAAVATARAAGASDLRLLHCVSGYPTPPEQCNLAAIETLRERQGCLVGWSDHSAEPVVVRRAVHRWGAVDVEVHLDLDGRGNEAGEHNWTPERLRLVIASLREADTESGGDGEGEIEAASAADGDGAKRPMPVEQPDVAWRADPLDGLRPLRAIRAGLPGTGGGARAGARG